MATALLHRRAFNWPVATSTRPQRHPEAEAAGAQSLCPNEAEEDTRRHEKTRGAMVVEVVQVADVEPAQADKMARVVGQKEQSCAAAASDRNLPFLLCRVS
ncbi:unnamed protein product [Protopolystoma xenopodis]|uniref:Uncharacterized protein n=1 Tax=Protopolystoma xenopodis TaxID=117903 RepID=A0A3S5ANQ3_9PLAT|nr:unnamed protein product [Protopolystoma xenopodis]